MKRFASTSRTLMLIATAALSITSSHSFAGVDEYGASGTIPGVQFTGGDGSYERAVKDGITIAICSDFPFNYQDEKTKQPAGMDVEILKEVARRLGITNLKWELMPIDSVIPALVSKRVDLIGDNLHENPKRLEVVSFTSPAYFYGGAFATQKGNPPGISDWASLAGKNVGVYRIKSLVGAGFGVSLMCKACIGAVYSGVVYREARDGNGPSRISYAAYWQGDNDNPALEHFLKLLDERYPLLSNGG